MVTDDDGSYVNGDVNEFDSHLVIDENKTRSRPQLRFPQWFSGMGKRLLLSGIVAATTLGSFMWGFHFSVIAGAMLFVDDYFHLSALWHEVIVSLTIAGATIGAATAGELSDKLGRRKALMISAVLYAVGAVVMGMAFSHIFLVIGRTVVGLAIGMYT